MNSTSQKHARTPDAAAWHSLIAEQFDAGYRRSPAFIERLNLWSKLIEEHADPHGDTLDAGCGSGVITMAAAKYSRSVVAFDASGEMVRLAQEKRARASEIDNVTIRELRMENIPHLGEGRFSLALSSSVLEYLDDMEGAIRDLAGSLRPGGVLIVSLPNMQSIYRRAERVIFRVAARPRYLAYVKSQPNLAEFSTMLRASGLVSIDMRLDAAVPLLSPLARHLRCPHLVDNLIVHVCRKS